MTAAALLICAFFVARQVFWAGSDWQHSRQHEDSGYARRARLEAFAVATLSILAALAFAFLAGWLAAS